MTLADRDHRRCDARDGDGRRCLLARAYEDGTHDGLHCALGPKGWLWFGKAPCKKCHRVIDVASDPVECPAHDCDGAA